MRLARPFRVAAVVLLAVPVGFAVGYAVGGTTGLIVALAAAQLLLLALALGAWRDHHLAHQRLRAELRTLDARVHGSGAALREAIGHSEHQVRAAVESAAARLERDVQDLSHDLSSRITQVEQAQPQQRQKTVDALQAALRKQFQQVEALAALYHGLQPQQPIPPTRNWAASPDLLRYLHDTARQGSQRLILECGSGVSTLVFAYGLRARGAGHVVALEHDEHYAEVTKALLRDHGLQQWAEVRLAPLKPVTLEGESWPWYELSAVPPGPIDLLLVDGPPGTTREHARFPAMPLLHDRLAPGAAVVLDDHHREQEREVAQRWLKQFPDLRVEELRHEKGTAVLTLPPG